MKRQMMFLLVCFALLLSFVQSPARANATANPTATVLARRLRVREMPSLRSKTVAVLKRGEALTILGKNAMLRALWLKVQTTSGVVGWVSSRWLRLGRGILLKNLPVVG